MNTAQPFGVGATPLTVAATTSFCMGFCTGRRRQGPMMTPQAGKGKRPLWAFSEAEEADSPGPRLLEHRGLVENDDPPRFKGRRAQARVAHRLEGLHPEARDVEAEVLAGLDGLDEERLVRL